MDRDDIRSQDLAAPGDPTRERPGVHAGEMGATATTRDVEHNRGLEGNERTPADPAAIRSEDTEPYIGLQYVARLFKIAAMVVVVALVAEIVAAFALEGISVILPLLAEIVQGAVLAAILWGAGDLTLLSIDVGHDVRAARVLLGRLSARIEPEPETHRES